MSAHIVASIKRDPHLIQISTAWGTHANGVLGRGQYVEIAIAKPSRNGHAKQSPEQKKCTRMKQAIIVEGGGCGRMVYVCADVACEIHHAESRKAREAQERTRTEQRNQDERRKQDLVTRRRVLAAILEKVSAPLSKADLELVAREFSSNLPQQYRTLLIERHTSTQDKKPKTVEIGSTLKNLDETGYSRLLIELSLLDTAHNPYADDSGKLLEHVAKRYRLNVEKIAESVAAEFAARRSKREQCSKAKTKRA